MRAWAAELIKVFLVLGLVAAALTWVGRQSREYELKPLEKSESKWSDRQADLPSLAWAFKRKLIKELKRLGPENHVVLLGAKDSSFALQLTGLLPVPPERAREVLETAAREQAPRITTVAYGDQARRQLDQYLIQHPQDAEFSRAHFEILVASLLEDLSPNEVTKRFGPADLAIDYWGYMSTTRQPVEDLQWIHRMLKVGGKLFLHDPISKKGKAFQSVQIGSETLHLSEFIKDHVRGFDVQSFGQASELRRGLILTKNRQPFYLPKLRYLRSGMRQGSDDFSAEPAAAGGGGDSN